MASLIAPRHTPAGTVTIEAESRFPTVSVTVRHLEMMRPKQHILRSEQSYRLDLCITSRLPSRMQFTSWAATRFECPGRLFIVPPGETLGILNAVGCESVVVCNIATDAMSRWLADSLSPPTESLDSMLDVSNEAIEHLMLRMTDEIRHPGFASDIMVEAYAMQIAVELHRHYREAAVTGGAGGLAPWRLRRIEERVKLVDDPPNLSELAALCGLSVRQLSRGFQTSRGLSIGHYVTRHRIDKAKQYLAAHWSIKAVAYQLGFNSSAAFCSAFRKVTGVTPSAFRRLASAGK